MTISEEGSKVNETMSVCDRCLQSAADLMGSPKEDCVLACTAFGEDIPDHLAAAGALRLEHAQASLEELGQFADPPLTKDAVAGRIRRLLAMADKRASDLGLPSTEADLTADMLHG